MPEDSLNAGDTIRIDRRIKASVRAVHTIEEAQRLDPPGARWLAKLAAERHATHLAVLVVHDGQRNHPAALMHTSLGWCEMDGGKVIIDHEPGPRPPK